MSHPDARLPRSALLTLLHLFTTVLHVCFQLPQLLLLVGRQNLQDLVVDPTLRHCGARTDEGERVVNEKPNDFTKLVEKMRTNTAKQIQQTGAIPLKRFRKKMLRTPHADGAKKQE